MQIFHRVLDVHTEHGIDFHDLSGELRHLLAESGIRNGLLTVSSRHTTTALMLNENESRLLEDLRDFLQRLVPADAPYRHNDIHLRDCAHDEPENAHSHLMGMLLSSSESIPVHNGELGLGTWQSLMLCELDGPRNRTLNVQILGE